MNTATTSVSELEAEQLRLRVMWMSGDAVLIQLPDSSRKDSMSKAITELDALKNRLRATWMSGDFDKIAQVEHRDAASRRGVCLCGQRHHQ